MYVSYHTKKKEVDMKYPPLGNFETENNQENMNESLCSQQINSNENFLNVPVPCVPPYELTLLDMLAGVGLLYVKQEVELLEAVTGFKIRNKYTVTNNLVHRVFYATEKSNFSGKIFMGSGRAVTMKVFDSSMKEILLLTKTVTCRCCCLPFKLPKLKVYTIPTKLIGIIEQEWNLFTPTFRVNNEFGVCVLNITGPFFISSLFFGSRNYEVYSADKKISIGRITKHWGGLIRELYTDADNYSISFPVDLDVRMKAVLLAACFFIDVMYYDE